MSEGFEFNLEKGDSNVAKRAEGPPKDEQYLPREMTARLAHEFHEDWRKTRLNPDTGKYEPRVKTTKDEEWIKAHGTEKIDIANTSYEDLPSDWQAENKAAAEVVVKGISESVRAGQSLSDAQTIESLAEQVHQAWLTRNGAWAPAEQKLPYKQLAEAEQAKDRDQVLKGVQIYQNPTPL